MMMLLLRDIDMRWGDDKMLKWMLCDFQAILKLLFIQTKSVCDSKEIDRSCLWVGLSR